MFTSLFNLATGGFRRLTALGRSLLPALALWSLAAGPAAAGSIAVALTDHGGAPVDDAVVYALPLAGGVPPPHRNAAVDQVNKEFVPYVSAVQTGTLVNFPNKDNIRHHVYSFSPAKTFELKLYSGTPAKPVLFDKPGPVVLGCNIHDWMLAYVYVVDTPYFAVSGKGTARLEGMPPGEYEVRVWHPQLKGTPLSQRVSVGAQEAALRISLELGPKPATGSTSPAKGGT